ncbi:MAG: polyphosphate kinase 2 family protein [Bacteroidetes bacterium]|jgi:PPK2 family polyphosphate:nucleotide phosphotransferase|nr:polyphosphate kinase 2 family protein [Bacteroidota bacterium]
MAAAIDYSRYRVPGDGSFRIAEAATDDDQGLTEDAADDIKDRNEDRLDDLQERLFAERRQSLLVVFQAMDAGGKDSTIRKVLGDLNPQGCRVYGFKAPTTEEREHDFLWRIHAHTPRRGIISVFNRSHYEDVLIARVKQLAPEELIEKRYDHINHFEALLTDHGTRVVKFLLNISKEYQLERLRRRLRRSDKHWKFNPQDLAERKRWDAYMEAFEVALQRCSTPHAPWYVIPAETRWFRDAVVSQILVDTLEAMNPQFPPPAFDPADYPPESIR